MSHFNQCFQNMKALRCYYKCCHQEILSNTTPSLTKRAIHLLLNLHALNIIGSRRCVIELDSSGEKLAKFAINTCNEVNKEVLKFMNHFFNKLAAPLSIVTCPCIWSSHQMYERVFERYLALVYLVQSRWNPCFSHC